MVASNSTAADERLRQERDFYRRLLELGMEQDIAPLLNRALKLAVEVTGAISGYIELRDETLDAAGNPSLWWRARGMSPEAVTDVQRSVSRGVIAEAMATGKSVRSGSAMDDARFQEFTSVQINELKALLCAPIGSDPSIGVVYLQGRKDGREFSEEDQWHAEMFARHLLPFADRLIVAGLRGKADDPTREARAKCDLRSIVGSSPALAEALHRLALVAPLPIDVLLTGPTGTGKTIFARVIAKNSAVADGPFVELNCATVPEDIAESELFGARQGAHSTATRDREGKVHAAEGGTLFLDEVGDLPLGVQVKLLQFLQEKTYRPLGSTELRQANVRIIAATNRDLRQLMADGQFREDLYYRLHTMPIHVPALRDRPRDVLDLLRHFLARFSAQPPLGLGLGAFRASPGAVHAAESYAWPGNVRELEHRTRTAMLLCHGQGAVVIERCHLFPETITEDQSGDEGLTFHEATRRFQRRLLLDVLRRTQWNKTEAAQLLDISRSSIHNYIRAFGIDE